MRGFWKNQKGVTMMEVLVTVAILAIVVVPCLSSFVMAQKGNVLAKQTFNEYTEAQNLMEKLKADGQKIEQSDLNALCEEDYPSIFAEVTSTKISDSEQEYMIITVYDVDDKDSPSREIILKGVVIITP